MRDERKICRPDDLALGQMKVVVYACKGCTIIVPDPAWDMKGDLSRLPREILNVIENPIKNNVRITQAIVGGKGRTLAVPPEDKVFEDIKSKGFSVDSSMVIMLGEYDSHGNKIQ